MQFMFFSYHRAYSLALEIMGTGFKPSVLLLVSRGLGKDFFQRGQFVVPSMVTLNNVHNVLGYIPEIR